MIRAPHVDGSVQVLLAGAALLAPSAPDTVALAATAALAAALLAGTVGRCGDPRLPVAVGLMGIAFAAPAVAGVAVLGAVGLLVLVARDPGRRNGGRHAASVLAGPAALAAVALIAPAPGLLPAVELLAWSGAAAVGLLLVTGSAARRPLPRRIGFAFITLAVAHAVGTLDGPAHAMAALELAAVAMVLVAAVSWLVGGARATVGPVVVAPRHVHGGPARMRRTTPAPGRGPAARPGSRRGPRSRATAGLR